MPQDRFYLTEWTPEGNGEIRHLTIRQGGDDGEDAVMAKFSRYPDPLGEQLAQAALTAANTYAIVSPAAFGPALEGA